MAAVTVARKRHPTASETLSFNSRWKQSYPQLDSVSRDGSCGVCALQLRLIIPP